MKNLPNESEIIPIFKNTYQHKDHFYKFIEVRGINLRILDEKDDFEFFNCNVKRENYSMLVIAVLMKNYKSY